MRRPPAQNLLGRRGSANLDAQQTWSPGDTDERFSLNAYGAVFAEVAVDELLGTVRVRRIYACFDAGRTINPRLAHSQAIGGFVGESAWPCSRAHSWTTATAAS